MMTLAACTSIDFAFEKRHKRFINNKIHVQSLCEICRFCDVPNDFISTLLYTLFDLSCNFFYQRIQNPFCIPLSLNIMM